MLGSNYPSFTRLQQIALVVLRFAIGWHLFYQGVGKVRAVQWSAEGYLAVASGPFGGIFQWLAESPRLLWFVDLVTVWGLVVAGLLLMLGLFTRTAALVGTLLLLLFYLAAPPLWDFTVATIHGTELYIDKTFIEMLALAVVLVFPTGKMAGLDILVTAWWRRRGRDRYFSRR